MKGLLPAAVIALLIAGCGAQGADDRPSQQASPTATTQPTPSATDAPTRSPSPQPSADTRPCRPNDLRVEVGPIGVGLGNTNLPATFVNDSSSACAIIGYPSLVGVTSAGAQESIPVGHGSYFGDPGPPANLAPGGLGFAVVNISGADACQAAQSGRHKVYKVLRIGLPAGGSVDVAGSGFDTICGVSVSSFGVPAAASRPLALPPLPQGAEISAPTP